MQFISFFILTLSNCGTIFVMGVLIMQELYFAHFQGGYSVYSVPHNLFEINVLHGIINSHQLIELILFVVGQPHNCNCWQPGNFSVLKKCNGKLHCLIIELIFMKKKM